jgi:hypothetical protein
MSADKKDCPSARREFWIFARPMQACPRAKGNYFPGGEMSEPRELALMDKAMKMLAEATTIEEIKLIRDKAQAGLYLVRSRKLGIEFQQRGGEIIVVAERMMGEFLSESAKNKGAAVAKDNAVTNGNRVPTLADHGITKRESVRFQELAAIPPAIFEKAVAAQKDSDKPVSSTAIIRAAAKPSPKEKTQPENISFDDSPKLAAAKAAHKLFRDIATDFRESEKRVLAAFEKGEHFARFLGQQRFSTELQAAIYSLRCCAPYADCCYCSGDGCKACKDTGWLPKQQYEMAPRELKPKGKA